MKVLLLGAGRRVSLAKRFIAHGFDVYSYETEVKCPIASVGKVIEGKKWDDQEANIHIEETINSIKPDLVLPLADKATSILSNISYKGIITAKERANNICLNKAVFEWMFGDCSFYPKVGENGLAILKPKFGANSKGLKIIDNLDWEENREVYSKDYVAQRKIDGFEISVDAYFNKDSKMIDAVPRERIEVQGGEVCRSITLERDVFWVVELTRNIGEDIGLVGPVCAQYIVDKKAYIMEINARFGGGVILSLEAGFDMIDLLKREYVDGEVIEPQKYDWKVGFGMTRYFSEYFYE